MNFTNEAEDKEHAFDDFIWGVSTAAYQIEGAYNKDGKGPSIWDVFSNTPGKTYQNQNANHTCDFYHHCAQDIALMSQMNIPNFRFSLSWSRIFPHGTGLYNQRGVDFYNRVIDFCLELGIEPWITLYHWDLPHELEKKGGWTNRQVVDWFCDYVAFCIKKFGDRVKHWMVLNEPMVFTGAGYFLGVHAPGRRGINNFLAAAHHAALCQAEGARVVKDLLPQSKVGTTFSCSYIEPYSFSTLDNAAALKVDALLNRLFIEPLLGKGYPLKDLKLLQRMELYIKDGDEQRLAFDMDFIGIQNYTREVAAHSYFTPFINAKLIKASRRKVEITEMDWEVYPPGIYEMLRKYAAYKEIKEIIVTENGAAFPDIVTGSEVNDCKRTAYLQQYIAQVLKAKNEGMPVTGYFVWSFTDNFEWSEGYRARFGLVHIDYQTQRRIIKQSGLWFSEMIRKKTLSKTG